MANNGNRGMRTYPMNLFGSLGNFIYGMGKLGIIAMAGFFGLLALAAMFCSIYFVSPWWADGNAANTAEQVPAVNHYYYDTTNNGVANNGTGVVQNGNGYSPVDSAVGAPASALVIDQSEGGCNNQFDPQILLAVATAQNVHVVVQAHNGPNGLRCVLVVQDATRESQVHALTGSFSSVSEIAAINPSIDRLSPNPANLQGCLNNGLLINLYTGGPISPDPNKVDNNICN